MEAFTFPFEVIQNIFNMLQLLKEKQFTWGSPSVLQSQKAEDFQEEEKLC